VIKTNQQRVLWEFYSRLEEFRRDKMNMLGPYKAGKDDEIGRHFNCRNYESCLGLASASKWESFTCTACRRTNHGHFE
jgi:hypothetical protein